MFRFSKILGNLAMPFAQPVPTPETRIFFSFVENIEAHKRLKAITVLILPEGGKKRVCAYISIL